MMKYMLRLFCTMCIVGALFQPAYAVNLEDGAYTAPAETFYINPDTGVTDDTGNNPDIGEGMCRSAVGDQALIEQDGEKTYVTIRMKLSSNLKNISFSVQQTAGDPASYEAVTTEITAENGIADTRDYRMEVPAANSLICCEMYVTPMGRDVKFYIQVNADGAAGGSGNFVTDMDAGSSEGSKAGQTIESTIDYADHWGSIHINTVLGKGLVDLESAGIYRPDANVTRRVFVTGLARLSGVEQAEKETGFADVPQTSADAAYIAWASENGIVNGKGEGLFAPDDSITREEMAAMLYRYMLLSNAEIPAPGAAFPDESQISSWALEAVRAVQAAGLINGKSDGRFDPQNTATRAEYAVILAGYAEQYT